jgi:hypothetical protein
MNSASKSRLAKVHPALASTITSLDAKLRQRGIQIEVVQGLRTHAEQDRLFAQGRSKSGKRVTNARGGQSNHNYGTAVDVAPSKDGKIDWDDDDAFEVIGQEGKSLGLEWGGDWRTFVDRPHLQIPAPPISALRVLYDKGGLPAVWQAVKTPAQSGESVSAAKATETKPVGNRDDGTQTGSPASGAIKVPGAKDVKIAQMSPTTKTISFSLIGGSVLKFIQEMWQSSQQTVLSASQYALAHLPQVILIVGLAALGIWIYNQSAKRAAERTKQIVELTANREKDDVIIT